MYYPPIWQMNKHFAFICQAGYGQKNVKERFSEAIKSLKDPLFETMINSNENGERIKGKIKKSDIEKIVTEHS
jgi:predicted HAD superfamily phosphohydrolase YqeG